ncbi:T9SS type A sorting domain-containing protein [Faecalibacter macacae]|uniref:T9SS C-terminal target domain-containing protein n=1 Tax=Faecalibacter macacae TaxID=1859289 RepID=A0A3L9M3C4_9FLAO|nr:T9SS type A sorting domain-containing protein [Faecalibacter macacae]RLZ07332.1 T9SS C-terminal target domain-containing protein [Faecalibacter macacae]
MSQSANAQLHLLGIGIQGSDVNNSGLVGATANNVSSYFWTAESGLTQINTLGVNYLAGRTLVSENNDKVIVYATNPETETNTVAEYTISTGELVYLPDFSGNMDASSASPWGISNDGNHIVGLGYFPNADAHAIKWDGARNVTDMGTTTEDRASRANAVNDDGTVIVGWQDADSGARQAARWVNGEQTILTDNNGNVLGEAGAVSADGNTVIGLMGLYPYIWTPTSYTEITHPQSGTFFRGGATSLTADGNTVIGYFRGWPGAPHFGEGFIWDAENGRRNLNEYAESLGIDTQGYILALPLAISPDGTKITGTAKALDGGQMGFYLDLSAYLNTSNIAESKNKVSIYPNPVIDVLNISGLKTEAKVEITNILGQKVKTEEVKNNKINVQNLTKGTYVISVTENGTTTNHKFIKK